MNPTVRSHATVEELFRLLPPVEELEALRLAIMEAAVPDPATTWDSSSAYATVDKRIVASADLARVVVEGEAVLHEYVSVLFRRLDPLFRAYWRGADSEASRELIGLGEWYERNGGFVRARQCFDAALSLALPLPEKGPQTLALRRIGRVRLAVGELREAREYYQRSAAVAHDAGDRKAEVIARTGIGNVLSVQGWWREAEESYRAALALAEAEDDPLPLERAQLYNNLGLVAARQQRNAEAREWLDRALALWSGLDSPDDLAVCYHNFARVHELEGDAPRAREARERALGLARSPHVLAGIAIDHAESFLAEQRPEEARRWAREAEQHALVARSPYLLGRIYHGLGNVARASGDADGFVFYEKALEIARERGLPFLEADALVDYAALRGRTGEVEEAQAFLERAVELSRELGAMHELERAEKALAEIVPPPPQAGAE